jgi:hypothetical protein
MASSGFISQKYLLDGRSWNTSRARQIDEFALVDLLGIIHYEADRAAFLDRVGFQDNGSVTHVLLDYVLDVVVK